MSLPIFSSEAEHGPSGASSPLTRLVGEVPMRAEEEGKAILVLEVRSQPGSQLSPLALAGVLAKHEAEGDHVEAVRLLVRDREDADWAVALLDWLCRRDYVVVLRTRARLRGDLLETLRGTSVPVEFELAHHDPELQRILLDGEADSVQQLLLQAQHLAVIGIEQSVRFGPLLPGVHDEAAFRRLVALVRGADLEKASFTVGSLRSDTLAALADSLGSAQAMALTRTFRVSPMVLFEGLETSLRLPPNMRRGLEAAYRRIATKENDLQLVKPVEGALERQGRGPARRGALALELFAENSLAAS